MVANVREKELVATVFVESEPDDEARAFNFVSQQWVNFSEFVLLVEE